MAAYTDADVQAAGRAIVVAGVSRDGGMSPSDSARAVLDAVAPAIAARAKAEAWDEGYAVASDDFTHSDYCGFKCQCEGIHGQANPYRADEIARTP